MAASQGVMVGVDVGGTFTDVVVHEAGKPQRIVKIPSTRGDPSVAVLSSIRHMGEHWGVEAADIGRFIHGTTVATNAVLERKGARIGVITTKGFKDVLEIGRQIRQAMYSVILEPETPVFLAPGAMRKEALERLTAKGEVLVPLDEDSVAQAADELVAGGAQAVAIVFLFSFLDPRHEIRAREIVRARHPDLPVSISSEVDPAFREYERTVVTAFDAYIKPVVDKYLERLEGGLGEGGVDAPLQIMQSRGGLAAAAVARQRPVRLFLSGPAAGVIGGRMVGEMSDINDIITVDIGGTSCDIALIAQGKPMIRAEGKIGGYPVRVQMVDVNTIGSGGGSIAWLDGASSLKVGPHSAGSEPGPACYGRGGEEATVTDASIVLGYLDPEYFAGGTLKLRPELAHKAVEEKIAKPLGMSVGEAALGIHRVLNAQMVEGIRLVSIRQGMDPRNFALIPLGGAGPLHATALAADLSIRRILLPRHPGVLSAAGLLAAPVEHETSTAFPRPLKGLAVAEVRGALDELDRQCAALMAVERVAAGSVGIQYFVDMCYIGQSYYLEVPLDMAAADPLAKLYRDFLAVHDRIYGYSTEADARIVNLRSTHQAAGGDQIVDAVFAPAAGKAEKGTRKVLLAGQSGPVPAKVYDRAYMPAGMTFAGPAIIEQADTTTLVEPGWHGEVTANGNIILTAEG